MTVGRAGSLIARTSPEAGDTQSLTTEALEKLPAQPGDVDALLDWAVNVGTWAPTPGAGETAALWELLARTGAADLSAARALEPHLDALAILAQSAQGASGGQSAQSASGAGHSSLESIGVDAGSKWGVFAAEVPGHRVTASIDDGCWRLVGSKAWCSLAGHLSHALVTATNESGQRQLFAVDLRGDGVDAASGPWHPRGLTAIVSAPVIFAGAPAIAVGEPGWYLSRPGFAWGGMGVAACWWGAAAAIATTMFRAALARTPDQLAESHLGRADVLLNASRAVLSEAADAVDANTYDREGSAIEALRVRGVVATTVDDVIRLAAHSLGPSPLALDEEHARRVADLELYVRQHHAERDDAALGRALLAEKVIPW